MGLSRALPGSLLLLLLLASVGPARAEDRAAEAETEMVKARRAMERQEFEIAVGHLLVARSLAPATSGPYLNLGLAYAALGRCDQAVPMLEEYLRRKAKDPQPSAAATLTACRAAIAPPPTSPPSLPPVETPAAQAPTTTPEFDLRPIGHDRSELPPAPPPPARRPAHLVIRVEPVDGDVSLNGQRVASATRLVERDLPAGGYQLSVERRGYLPVVRGGWLVDGGTTVEQVTLKRRRLWPTIVAVGAGALITGGVVSIGAVAVAAQRPSVEVAFSTETIP